jgi:hypothetical protein
MRMALSAGPPVIVVASSTSYLVARKHWRPSGRDIAVVVLNDDVPVPSLVNLLTDCLCPVRRRGDGR